MDVAPNFSGTLFGMSNTVSGGVMGLVVPTVVGAITNDNMTASAWCTVFLGVAFCYFIGNVVYLVFVRTEPQSWQELG